MFDPINPHTTPQGNAMTADIERAEAARRAEAKLRDLFAELDGLRDLDPDGYVAAGWLMGHLLGHPIYSKWTCNREAAKAYRGKRLSHALGIEVGE